MISTAPILVAGPSVEYLRMLLSDSERAMMEGIPGECPSHERSGIRREKDSTVSPKLARRLELALAVIGWDRKLKYKVAA